MTRHECPRGLATCPDHPKWHVVHVAGHYWFAYRPYGIKHDADFNSWREAFDYALREAAR